VQNRYAQRELVLWAEWMPPVGIVDDTLDILARKTLHCFAHPQWLTTPLASVSSPTSRLVLQCRGCAVLCLAVWREALPPNITPSVAFASSRPMSSSRDNEESAVRRCRTHRHPESPSRQVGQRLGTGGIHFAVSRPTLPAAMTASGLEGNQRNADYTSG
jgi:hypothetical protein